eukprot:CAMPEP_0119137200 /NCGR_PEP_ID=MMETSP1310-20130426/23152_1 /TAXON_ID=464262 /ORGANISM="Genus nov. species nov., Strain RCC2339" /LENGTH=185 /DNA_ID=CAMNT_0007128267 /DNA_START=27 /DNA_END=584 /DNA_ORIENTATION=+
MDPFNVTEYTRAQWFVQQQMPVAYLQYPDDFYCTSAQYLLTSNTTVNVYNYNTVGEVNGPTKGGCLCAVIKDPSVPSKLSVGPCVLPTFTYGPYWVLAAGPSENNYEWALISGGQPTIDTGNGCTTGSGTNGSGLWIFSRTQVAPQEQVDMVIGIAKSMGFDTSVLYPVQQEGCLYSGFEGPSSC